MLFHLRVKFLDKQHAPWEGVCHLTALTGQGEGEAGGEGADKLPAMVGR